MNLGQLNFALKMIQDAYKLSEPQVQILSRRMMADEKEFDRVWSHFKERRIGNGDTFRELLVELLS